MKEDQLTSIILDKLNRDYDEIVRVKNPEIYLGDLIYAILKYKETKIISDILSITWRVLVKLNTKTFNELKSPGRSWVLKLTDLVGYKLCTEENIYKHISKFGKTSINVNGLASMCKECDSIRLKTYRKNNVNICRIRIKEHYNKNKDYYTRKNIIRKIKTENATPKWANLEKIKLIYKLRPKDYHVDHIIPLQSKYVCGLHVENNLQYLLAKDNWSKGNIIEI